MSDPTASGQRPRFPREQRAQAIIRRSAALRYIRDFFHRRGFVEADPPLLLDGVPTESTIQPFRVRLRRLSGLETRYLPTSPEAGLKKALATLKRPCFEIGHAFRNGEEEGHLHRAHFRMVEWYRIDSDYRDILADAVQLLRGLYDLLEAQPGGDLPLACTEIHSPWQEISVSQALKRYSDVSLEGPRDLELLPHILKERGLGSAQTWQDALCTLLALEVEPRLGWRRPTVLLDYPTGLASQARPHPQQPWLAQQFELFIAGVELGNCYSEITDPRQQRLAFQAERRRGLASPATPPGSAPVDPDYLDALANLPDRCAGGSLGLDRVLMVLSGAHSLDQVRLDTLCRGSSSPE